MLTEFARQALGQDAKERIGKIIRVHPHLYKADNCFRRAIGMESAENQMSGQGRLYCDLGSLRVPHLTDHDHIRIGAKKGAERIGKIEADFRMDLYLAQAALGDLYRVFSRPDLADRRIDVSEGRMEACGLARAGRADTKDDAIRFREDFPEFDQIWT